MIYKFYVKIQYPGSLRQLSMHKELLTLKNLLFPHASQNISEVQYRQFFIEREHNLHYKLSFSILVKKLTSSP